MTLPPPTFAPSSRGRLTSYDLGRFESDSLFDRIGRAVCAAGCLPRKELYEAWEVGRRARRLFRGGRVVDVGGGHGLLAHVMLLLDDSSPDARVVDPNPPASAATLSQALVATWPRLTGRVRTVPQALEAVELARNDVVVSCHACGALTDRVLDASAAAQARIAVLPCCHDASTCDPGGLLGWLDASMAIDVTRAATLRARGYDVRTQVIPRAITPKHRLLIGMPPG